MQAFFPIGRNPYVLFILQFMGRRISPAFLCSSTTLLHFLNSLMLLTPGIPPGHNDIPGKRKTILSSEKKGK